VLTHVDVTATLKEKLNETFRPYSIFGVCNPGFAHRLLTADPRIGLVLPCKVIVEAAEGGGSLVRVITVMTFLGVIEQDLTSVIPIGSMMVYGAMNTNALMMKRFRSEVGSHVGQIEAGLVLGASPEQVIRPYTRRAVTAALTPNLNGMRSLGIVRIPGAMAGMVLSGQNPAYAGFYQFVVSGSIFVTAGITVLISIVLLRRQVFSKAEQLLLHGEEQS
jgi:putative ABC transport system permease protein